MAGAALCWFFCWDLCRKKERKEKKEVSHSTDSEEKLSGYTEGTAGKNSAEAILFLRSAESAGQDRKHQTLTHS